MKPLRSWTALVVLVLAVAVLATGVYAVLQSDRGSVPPPIATPGGSPTGSDGDVPTAPPSPPVTTPVPPTKTPHIRPPEPPDVTPTAPTVPTVPTVPPPDVPRSVPVAAYQLAGAPDRLRLHYYIGVPECHGVVDPSAGGVTVTETVDAVRVLLRRTEPRSDPDTACIDIAIAKTVTVQLQRPLGTRTVIDASTGEAVPQGRT